MALQPTVTHDAHTQLEAGDVALHWARWTIRGRDETGNPALLSGRLADNLRHQNHGRWLLALDKPCGNEHLP